MVSRARCLLLFAVISILTLSQHADGESPALGPHDMVLPVVADITGRNGAHFHSMVEIMSFSVAPTDLRIVFTPRSRKQHRREILISVPGETLLTFDDPQYEWFGIAGKHDTQAVGSLLFLVPDDAEPEDLKIKSVITARNQDGSEYRQLLPSWRSYKAAVPGTQQYFAASADPARSRVNFTVTATADSTRVIVAPVAPVTEQLATGKQINLDTGGSAQINDVHTRFGLDRNLARFALRMTVLSGAAVGLVSVVDGNDQFPGANDAITVLATRFDNSITLLELESAQGGNELKGSVVITSISQEALSIRAELFLRDVPGISATSELSIGAGETIAYPNVLTDLFGLANAAGTVVLTAPVAEPVLAATGHQYTVLHAGNDANADANVDTNADDTVIGTTGHLVPGLTEAGACCGPGPPGGVPIILSWYLIGLRQDREAGGTGVGAGERSDLAVFNPGHWSETCGTTE